MTKLNDREPIAAIGSEKITPGFIKVGDDYYNLAYMRVVRVDLMTGTPTAQIEWSNSDRQALTGIEALELVDRLDSLLSQQPTIVEWEAGLRDD